MRRLRLRPQGMKYCRPCFILVRATPFARYSAVARGYCSCRLATAYVPDIGTAHIVVSCLSTHAGAAAGLKSVLLACRQRKSEDDDVSRLALKGGRCLLDVPRLAHGGLRILSPLSTSVLARRQACPVSTSVGFTGTALPRGGGSKLKAPRAT